MLTVAQALAWSAQALRSASTQPRVEAEWLLAAALQRPYVALIAYPDMRLTAVQQQQFEQWVMRRQQGEPLAYILGSQPFWSLQLQVTPDTLIPRPETETLVAWVLQHLATDLPLRVADLGVGSGSIALALALERPRWQIDATDCNAATLAVAQANAQTLGLQHVSFYLGDWCKALPIGERYHAIISNPPYLAPDDPHLLALQHEPQRALVSESEGLADLYTLIDQAREHLLPEAVLVLEHGWTQAPVLLRALAAAGYVHVHSQLDLEQRPRFVTAVWPGR